MSQSSPGFGSSGVAATAIPAGAPVSPRSSSDRTFVREVSDAVKTINESGSVGEGQEVTFSFDRASRLPVIKVIDVRTKEVVSQWPAEYVLHLADSIKNKPRDS
jgi:uncharacterized FlaG/YvyC family protein